MIILFTIQPFCQNGGITNIHELVVCTMYSMITNS